MDSAKDCRSHIADSIPARLACYDLERKILWINEYSAELLGKEVEELIGHPCCEVWQNCKQPFMECHIVRALKTGEPQQAEIETPHGRTWALMAFPRKDENGGLAYVSEYGRDITASKKLKKLEDEINAITRHDLKSPALATLNIVRLMKDDDNLTPDQRELLQELERSGNHMLEIINQTLTLHKIEQGNYEAVIRRLNCLNVVREVCAYFKQHRSAMDKKIIVLVDGSKPGKQSACYVNAEESLLRTALMNIVKNALEASPPGEDVTIDIRNGRTRTIRIRNKGAVPEEARENFFGKYVTAGKRGGTGLGTYSAKMMIEAQNASIDMWTHDDDQGGVTEVVISF